jgi:hypothetical protein
MGVGGVLVKLTAAAVVVVVMVMVGVVVVGVAVGVARPMRAAALLLLPRV